MLQTGVPAGWLLSNGSRPDDNNSECMISAVLNVGNFVLGWVWLFVCCPRPTRSLSTAHLSTPTWKRYKFAKPTRSKATSAKTSVPLLLHALLISAGVQGAQSRLMRGDRGTMEDFTCGCHGSTASSSSANPVQQTMYPAAPGAVPAQVPAPPSPAPTTMATAPAANVMSPPKQGQAKNSVASAAAQKSGKQVLRRMRCERELRGEKGFVGIYAQIPGLSFRKFQPIGVRKSRTYALI